MNSAELVPEIIAQVRDLKEINRMLSLLEEDTDPVNEIMKMQFLHRKKEVITDVLSLLLKSEIDLKTLSPTLNKAVEYLRKNENASIVSKTMIQTVHEFESLID